MELDPDSDPELLKFLLPDRNISFRIYSVYTPRFAGSASRAQGKKGKFCGLTIFFVILKDVFTSVNAVRERNALSTVNRSLQNQLCYTMQQCCIT